MSDGTTALCLVLSCVAGIGAGLVGAAAMLRRARRGALPVDLPDDRRLHATPTPRGGGVGIPAAGLVGLIAGWWCASTIAGSREHLATLVLVWALPNGAMGLLDDYRPMRTPPKLAFQVLVATIAVVCGLRVDVIDVPPFGAIDLGAAGAVFSVLWLVWLANVFNFMDGMDALAAGCGALFCGVLTALALLAGAPDVACVALALGGALIGFLRYNVPPAKIFMGDGGSLFAGAILGGVALAVASPRVVAEPLPITAPALALMPFVFDATYTVVRRLLRGDPMKPHRTHLYQRLAVAGWTHGRVRAVYLAGTVVCGGAAVAVTRGAAEQAVALGVVLVCAAALVGATHAAERQRT